MTICELIKSVINRRHEKKGTEKKLIIDNLEKMTDLDGHRVVTKWIHFTKENIKR